MAVTIRDVAKKSGVSIATVSRVINNSDMVTDATREKVNEAIRQLGFIPNTNARALTTKITNTIGILVPDISNPFFGELIDGAVQQAHHYGYDIIISNSGYDSRDIIKDVLNLRSRDVDGIVMSSANVNESIIEYLRDKRFPFVLTGPVLSRYPVNYVSVDNIEGARIAVEHLIKLGHKKIGYILEVGNNYFNQLRLEGYKKALLSYQLPVERNLYFHGEAHNEVEKIKSMIKNDELTALFAFNDKIALHYMEVLGRNGIKIPQDISLVGFDNIKMASFYSIELTTIENRQTEFGKLAVKILLENIQGNENRTQQIIKKPKLVIRKSTAKMQ